MYHQFGFFKYIGNVQLTKRITYFKPHIYGAYPLGFDVANLLLAIQM